jgi:hypothetical protein
MALATIREPMVGAHAHNKVPIPIPNLNVLHVYACEGPTKERQRDKHGRPSTHNIAQAAIERGEATG